MKIEAATFREKLKLLRPKYQSWLDSGVIRASVRRSTAKGQSNVHTLEDAYRARLIQHLVGFGLSRGDAVELVEKINWSRREGFVVLARWNFEAHQLERSYFYFGVDSDVENVGVWPFSLAIDVPAIVDEVDRLFGEK